MKSSKNIRMTIGSAFDFFLLLRRGTGSSSRIVVVIRVRFAIAFAPWGKHEAIDTLCRNSPAVKVQ
jgi:hypothetical protein